MDIRAVKAQLRRGLKEEYFYFSREWPYKNISKKIIAEKYLVDKTQPDRPINDYKIYTISGKAEIMGIYVDRGIATKQAFFDRRFQYLDFTWGFDRVDHLPKKPKNFEYMFELAEKLAVGIPELRCDFYEVEQKVYFGELTFFDGGGFDHIEPIEWDNKLGDLLILPENTKKEKKREYCVTLSEKEPYNERNDKS